MKFKFFIIALSYFVTIGFYAQSDRNKFHLEIEMPEYRDSTVYLINFNQGNAYKLDSCLLSRQGIGIIEIDSSRVLGGQYALSVRPHFQMEMLIDDNQRKLKVFIPKDITKSTIVGSPDTEKYWAYLKQLNSYTAEKEKKENKQISGTNDKQRNKIQAEIDAIDGQIDELTQKVAKENEGTLLGAFLKGTIRLELPAELLDPSAKSSDVRKYVCEHFLDNLDMADPRLQRTNYFYSLIDAYINNWVDRDWDSITDAYSDLVARSKSNKLAFEQLLSAFLYKSLNSEVMGMENVWARLAEDYIFNKDIDIDKSELQQLEVKYELIKHNRVGMIAQDMKMQTIYGDSVNLSEIEAEYLILEFYNPTCTYCREDLTYLAKEFYPRYKDKGVCVVAFNLGQTDSHWDKFVADCSMQNFYNCSDPSYKSEYWMKYDTSRVPVNYILDKDKKIVGKKLNRRNLEKLFEILFKNGTN